MGLEIDLSGRTALITGASRGLGRAIALALGRAGANVVLTDLLIEDEAPNREQVGEYGLLAAHFSAEKGVHTRAAAEEIQALGGRAAAYKMDVTKPFDIEKVVRDVSDEWGGVDILVNNAALMENFGLMNQQDEDRFSRDLHVNLVGAFNCSKAVWPGMAETGWGRIINMSSIAADHGALAMPGYGASKAGLIGLTKSLALEGGRRGICVNAVLPGPIGTETLLLHKPEYIEKMQDRTQLKRLGRPEEVAALVAFLSSDLAGFITGAAIPITGGVELFGF